MIKTDVAWADLMDYLDDLDTRCDTPFYIYNETIISERIEQLRTELGSHFDISFAVKSNPNDRLLRYLRDLIGTYDVSSYGEIERVIAASADSSAITFSGPAKRKQEIKLAIESGVGELVLESIAEARQVSAICEELSTTQNVLVRIDPDNVPKGFGASMSGKSSQFGVDEEQLEFTLPEIKKLPGLHLKGFHIYSGTNCLDVSPLAENFEVMLSTFTRASEIANIAPERLVFGAGFGVPYLPDQDHLDVAALAGKIRDLINTRKTGVLASAKCTLELGRWLIAPAGLLITSVVSEKFSRGTEIRLCDAGFNNHLAACGMMGSVIPRHWRIENLTTAETGTETYNLVGPLCTSIDILARKIKLPPTKTGDLLAIQMSGAYGYTASPDKFISHPSARELWLSKDGEITDVTESLSNHWT